MIKYQKESTMSPDDRFIFIFFSTVFLFAIYLMNLVVYFARNDSTLCTENDEGPTQFAKINDVRDLHPLLYDCDLSHACELSIAWNTTGYAWWTMWTLFPKMRQHESKIRSSCCDGDGTPRTQPYIEGCYHEMIPGVFHHFSNYTEYYRHSTTLFMSHMCRSILYVPLFVAAVLLFVFVIAFFIDLVKAASTALYKFRRRDLKAA